MALQYDPRMYLGGAVELDSRPHTQLYGQLLAKKQAQQEAFDEYIRNLNKSVNSAGLRNVDRPVFDKKMSEWQKFGIENRDNIRKRIGGADIEFANKYQDIQNLIAESKLEEEKKKPLVEILTDPTKRELLDESSIEGIASHDQPLYAKDETGSLVRNPNRRSFDYSGISFNPKPFDQDKYFDQFKDVTRMELPPVISLDPTSKTQTTTTTSVFDQEAKDLIASRGVAEYMNNRSFKKTVDSLDPKEYNDFFKQNYGHDIQTPADLAAAYSLKGLQQKVVKTDVSPDTFARQKEMAAINDAYARRRQAMNDAYIKGRIDYKKASSQQDGDTILNKWINDSFERGKDQREGVYVKNEWQPARRIYVPKEIKKKYANEIVYKDKTKDIIEPIFFLTEDKKYVIPRYPGKSSKTSEPIPIDVFKGDLGKVWLTKKDAKEEIGDDLDVDIQVQSVDEPAEDDYTIDELKSAGWTDKQIEEGKKKGLKVR